MSDSLKIPEPEVRPAQRGWLRGYRRAWVRPDLVAGFTLAAYLLPSSLGDATLAGLPPETGLYACLFSGLVFWALCGSRHTSVTVTSGISLLMGSSLGALAGGDPARFAALAATTALLVAALCFLAWLLKGGMIVHFVSEAVMTGFKCGVALYLASTQLPKLCGFGGTHGEFWDCSRHFLANLYQVHPASLLTGLGALGVLAAGKVWLKNKPVGLAVVIGGMLAGAWCGLAGRGVEMLGRVPQGWPRPGVPAVGWHELNELLPLAGACFLVTAVETAVIGRMFAAKHGVRFDANREFLALAGANLAAGLGHGYTVGGGMSQSVVNEDAGARTPLSGLIAALVLLLVCVACSGLLRHLPQPVLAAIVLFAVTSLFKGGDMLHLWRHHRGEFVVAAATLLGVLGAGLLRGVLIGALISLLQLLRRATAVHVATLGRVPGTRRFTDIDRHRDNELIPGVLIFRPEASVMYFNCEQVREAILAGAMKARPALVIIDLSASPLLDMQGAQSVLLLKDDLAAAHIDLHIVEARSGVRDILRDEGADAKHCGINRFDSVADVVDDFLGRSRHGA